MLTTKAHCKKVSKETQEPCTKLPDLLYLWPQFQESQRDCNPVRIEYPGRFTIPGPSETNKHRWNRTQTRRQNTTKHQ